jgi:hypothetical protein
MRFRSKQIKWPGMRCACALSATRELLLGLREPLHQTPLLAHVRCTVCPRLRAALLACFDRAARETDAFGSFFIAFSRVRPRFVEPSSLVTGSSSPRCESWAAFLRVSALPNHSVSALLLTRHRSSVRRRWSWSGCSLELNAKRLPRHSWQAVTIPSWDGMRLLLRRVGRQAYYPDRMVHRHVQDVGRWIHHNALRMIRNVDCVWDVIQLRISTPKKPKEAYPLADLCGVIGKIVRLR